jgi:hypothetical protein
MSHITPDPSGWKSFKIPAGPPGDTDRAAIDRFLVGLEPATMELGPMVRQFDLPAPDVDDPTAFCAQLVGQNASRLSEWGVYSGTILDARIEHGRLVVTCPW